MLNRATLRHLMERQWAEPGVISAVKTVSWRISSDRAISGQAGSSGIGPKKVRAKRPRRSKK